MKIEHSHQVGVVIPIEDYRDLRRIVRQAQADDPGYSLGDLLRNYIDRGLKKDRRPSGEPPPRPSPTRQLNALAHRMRVLAAELKRNGA